MTNTISIDRIIFIPYFEKIVAGQTMLLGHFKDSRAHNLIIDLFSLPDEIPHELYGIDM